VLRLDRVGRDDRFLDLGGHSLLAVEVATRLGRAGVEAAIPDLFANPSVRRLAELASGRNPRLFERDPVLIRPGADATPLFLVHDGAASLLYAYTLADFVEPQIPVYGLPPVPLGDPDLTTIEGMASRMVRMIRGVRPEGPYRVAGWCTGGAIAYEIAVQLLGEDQEVEFVGLMSTTYHPPEHTPATVPPTDREALIGWLPTADEQRTELARQTRGLDFAEVVDAVAVAGLIPPPLAGLDPTEISQAVRRRFLVSEAGLRYFPAPLPLPVYYFSAVEHDPEHPYGRWDDALPDVPWRRVPVQRTHQSMMQVPDVRELGARLSESITASAKDAGRQTRPRSELLHTLQVGRPGTVPLLCLPGAGANVVSFHELIGALDPAMPVYGLQPRGVDGVDLPHATVAAAVDAYLAETDQLTAAGPVHLLGHSFGGWVAVELAARLRAAGRTVASLTLVDSEAPAAEADIVEVDDADALAAMAALFEELAGRSLGLTRDVLAPLGEADRRRLLHERVVEAGIVPRRTQPEVLAGPIRAFTRCLRTPYAARAGYPGRVALVTVDSPLLGAEDNAALRRTLAGQWRRVAEDLEVWHGPGNHMTILTAPHAAALADFLTRRCFTSGGRA